MTNQLLLVETMPPSARLVYHILQASKIMNTSELKSETQYSIRTIRYALQRLINAHLVIQVPDMTDTRRSYYSILS